MATVSKKVIVIGAGMAGLVSAFQLVKTGYEVVVLEARGRPGGRVETLRRGFSHGLFAEAGASYIADAHKQTMALIQEFNLPCDSVLPEDKSFKYFFGGELFDPFTRTDPWPDLTPEEQAMGLGGILAAYSGGKDIGNAMAPAWPHSSVKQYDDMSFSEFLHSQGASEGAIKLIRPWFAPWWDDLEKVSALFQLRDSIFGLCSGLNPKWYTIRSGMDMLPQAIASTLSRNIRYNSPVVEIRRDAKSVTVSYVESGARREEKGSVAICTIPFPALRKIKVTPRFRNKSREQ